MFGDIDTMTEPRPVKTAHVLEKFDQTAASARPDVIGAVIGEFVAAQEGLGYLILISTAQSQTSLAFAAIILLTLISVVIFYGIEFVERQFVTWTP